MEKKRKEIKSSSTKDYIRRSQQAHSLDAVLLFREIMTFLVQKVIRGLAGSCILWIFLRLWLFLLLLSVFVWLFVVGFVIVDVAVVGDHCMSVMFLVIIFTHNKTDMHTQTRNIDVYTTTRTCISVLIFSYICKYIFFRSYSTYVDILAYCVWV